jgi:plasmid stabilization system protein ParE
MVIILDSDEIKLKPAITSLECEDMLNEALAYIMENSPRQAQIMHDKFYEILERLERQPGIGIRCENGLRRIKLGKFRYHIYYEEMEEEVKIAGIWHTSRGTEFGDG